ncbi:alcohol dehydrogenase catalytic domain-containing protein [Christensenella tenuis]|uniref:alcohol dehydrogenase catalytic domain-containing protein n=1 Tax=Christensenella tenuis TaxID=2763033 RepID=UPI002ED0112C
MEGKARRKKKAVVFEEKGKFAFAERSVPKLVKEMDAIVRIALASACSSGLYIKHGSIPRAKEGVIVGHEMAGVVEAVGTGVKRKNGKIWTKTPVGIPCGRFLPFTDFSSFLHTAFTLRLHNKTRSRKEQQQV